MPITKAIPSDIDKFFEGTSVFFQASDSHTAPDLAQTTSTKSEKMLQTERSNGRTVAPNERTVERGNGGSNRTSKHMSLRKNRSDEGMREGVLPAQDQSEPAREPTVPPALADRPGDNGSTTPPMSPAVGHTLPTQEDGLPVPGASILARLKQGKSDPQEQTERYSFEIYRRQKEQIEDFLYQYKKRTGEKLSASRLIREALSLYFQTLDTHAEDQ